VDCDRGDWEPIQLVTPTPLPSKPRHGAPKPPDARERVVLTAYDLFCKFGIQPVGIDWIVAEAGVAKTTLYRHFRSKDELAVAVLQLREQRWTREWLETGVRQRARTPEKRLLAIFDLFHEWFQLEGYEGCLFMNTLLEVHDPTSPVRIESERRLASIHQFLGGLAEEAGIRTADDFAHQWQLIMLGSIAAASAGDRQAAQHARIIASRILDRELRP
jgi:AcrR family transcriptional regulator